MRVILDWIVGEMYKFEERFAVKPDILLLSSKSFVDLKEEVRECTCTPFQSLVQFQMPMTIYGMRITLLLQFNSVYIRLENSNINKLQDEAIVL